MTKYEWERELKKNLSRLPSDEVAKVLDYYNELFEDKSEGGQSEASIIREFGNPFDVARRIVNDFEVENGGGQSDERISGDTVGGDSYNGYTQEEIDGMPFFKAIKINLKKHINKVKRKLVGGNANAKSENDTGEKVQPQGNDIDTGKYDEMYTKKYDNINTSKYDKYDYKYEYKYEKEPDRTVAVRPNVEPQQQYEKTKTQSQSIMPKKKGGCAKVTAKIIFFFPFAIFAIVCWSVALSLTAAGFGSVLGGIWQVALNVLHIGGPFNLAQLGASLAIAGVGIIIAIIAVRLLKLFGKMTIRYFGGGKKKKSKQEQEVA